MKNRGEGRQPRMISIRWILSTAVVTLTTAILVTVGGLVERNARETLTRELQERALLEAQNLALMSTDALLSDYPELTLAPILNKMRERAENLRFATVVNVDGIIRGHADPRMIGTPFALDPSLSPVDVESVRGTSQQLLADESELVASADVLGHGGEPVGRTFVTMSRSYIDDAISDARDQQLLPFLILLVVAIGASIGLVSVLLRPIDVLRDGLTRIGRGDLDTPVELKDRTELGLLASTINEMSTRLRQAREEHIERERLSREVELAREIQSSLLPREDIHVGGCEIVGAHRPAAEVGGDIYDIFPLPNGRAGVVIADVSGKGLGGCMVASMIVALLRAYRDTETSPSSLLVRLNDSLVPSLRRGTFVTMFYGILDPASGEFVFASAAHCPLLVYRAATNKVEWHEPEAVPIGALRGNTFEQTIFDQRITLGQDDLLLQYTDGVNESFDIAGEEQFGFQRLAETVTASARGGCSQVIDAVRQRVADWTGDQPPLDDETLLAIRLSPGRAELNSVRASSASRISPLALLRRARQRGQCLKLRTSMSDLELIQNWVSDLIPTSCSSENLTRLQTALYETAANIVEHGYGDDGGRGSFELWWLPDRKGTSLEDGFFIFVDQSPPHSPDPNHRVDFAAEEVRRKGRGFGLEIVRAAMRDVSYSPDTPEGNMTVMVFDPQKAQKERATYG